MKTELTTVEPNEDKCACGAKGLNPHICPYQQDIYNHSETTCNCCEKCTQECANDI